MGLFFQNLDKPGPGIDPDAPRKTGLPRIAEVMSQHGWFIFKAGLLAFCSAIPLYVGLIFALQTHIAGFAVISGLVGGMILGPQIAGIVDTIMRALRDEPGIWWMIYKAAWKNNWKSSILPGAIVGMIFSCQVFLVLHFGTGSIGILTLLTAVFASLVFSALLTYVWPQITTFNMSFGLVVRNAVLLMLRYPGKSAKSAGIQVLYWAVVVLLFPLSNFILPITGMWAPMFLGIFIVYDRINEVFDIENSVKKLHEEQNQG